MSQIKASFGANHCTVDDVLYTLNKATVIAPRYKCELCCFYEMPGVCLKVNRGIHNAEVCYGYWTLAEDVEIL